MSDHLLRLARIVESIASGDGPHWPAEDVRQLIRDLEAAQTPEPQRRTITREEWALAVGKLSQRTDVTASEVALVCLTTWRLTVEDA